ncbi:conserved hypothetical protein [Perkinsus marinus ATCC 50983]|uniref:Sulfate transporter n=1 Tax=Perkinsus marinus (strain ATCC 50983 / TXsc) TaxID=423536 RepID=C5LDG3_PERM5|nr:conserved hypothetical protein [Perkinsus marinus ATCC 50983]EER05295.1 conserved hypothetical protein [Perkinsus marinus ATCC 50983]|eukprot:XP_002773479.1 conserved hypothetical protein [Perkinsus marinus ATCC 50983]
MPCGWGARWRSELVRRGKRHWKEATLAEFSGSLGDLGTFIPLAVGMSITAGLDFSTILIFTGVYNVASGVLFDAPIPVQPMKTIAAAAIAQGLTLGAVAAAGIFVSAVVLALGLLNLTTLLEYIIPLSIVRGIQLGLAVSLFHKGYMYAVVVIYRHHRSYRYLLVRHVDGSLIWNPVEQTDSFTLALLVTLLVLLNLSPPLRVPPPAALIVFLLGLIITIACYWSEIPIDRFGPNISVVAISGQDWLDGILNGGLPQLPLTLLNSVISVCALARELFGEDCRGGSTRHMAVSVGLMNLLGCWFGAMPCCHGCGGLAAQYRFGARTGTSVVMLGVLKLCIGLIFGPQLLHILRAYPGAVLGPMLCIAAGELGVQSLKEKGNLLLELQDPSLASWLLFITAAACVAAGSTGWGFAIGYGVWAIVAGVRWLARRWV